MQPMSHFEAEIPDPLRQNEPKLLTPGGVRTPAVGLLFLVFISKYALKGTSMQVESHHIGRSERFLRQGCVEQFVDHLAPRSANRSSGGGRRMRSDDHSCAWSGRRKTQSRKVKECPAGSRFGVGDLLIRWLGQASLHLRQVEEIVILASHHIGQSSQICHNGPIAILAI